MAQRVLVVGDDREIVCLVHAHLERSGFEVRIASDGETALHILRREPPDLVLLDLMVPEHDGLDGTRAVRRDLNLAAMPVIMLTACFEGHDDEATQQLPIVRREPGGDDDVARTLSPDEVVARVRAVLRRVQGEPTSPGVLQVGEVSIDLNRHRVEVSGQPVHLTPTEFALLRVLAEQAGHPLTRQEMIERGLGYNYEGLERTVDSHIKNLRRRLEQVAGATDLVETVFGVGYRLAAGDDA